MYGAFEWLTATELSSFYDSMNGTSGKIIPADRWRLLLTIMATKQKSNNKPLPLGDTLRDLAVLRVSSLDLASLIPASTKDELPTTEAAASVERSQGFIQSARSALKIYDVGTVDVVGQKLESLRTGLDEVSQGLETT